jgi:hypothetical protein
MSDILNIRVTERELDLIMDLLNEANDRVDADGQPAFELCHDLMEQAGRHPDDWDSDNFSAGQSFTVAEGDFVDHGMRAREMRKLNKQAQGVSMAMARRRMQFGEFSVEDPQRPSEIQRHDVFEHTTEEDVETLRKENSANLCGNDPIEW